MKESAPLQILCVVGSLNKASVTRVVIQHAASQLKAVGCVVDVLDFMDEPLALFNPESYRAAEGFLELKGRVERADIYLLGTPDYHGSISSAMKNFLDHFWHEFGGKLFGTIVASHEKGLTVTDQLRTVARQCYAWSLPYGLSFIENADVSDGKLREPFQKRLEMLTRDLRVYGELLTHQRQADLGGTEPGFMARLRK